MSRDFAQVSEGNLSRGTARVEMLRGMQTYVFMGVKQRPFLSSGTGHVRWIHLLLGSALILKRLDFLP